MKRKFIIVLAAALIVNLAGCGTEKNTSDNKTQNEQTVSQTDSKDNTTSKDDTTSKDNNTSIDNKNNSSDSNSNKSNSTAKASDSSSKNNNADNNSSKNNQNKTSDSNTDTSLDVQSFYGEWQIKGLITYPRVGPGIDLDNFIGKKIILSKDSASLGDDKYSSVKYDVSVQNVDDIWTGWRLSLQDLGINKDSATEIDITANDNSTMIFLVKDKNSLVYCAEGGFLEVTRIN